MLRSSEVQTLGNSTWWDPVSAALCVCVCARASQTVHLCSGAPEPKARVSQTLTSSGAAVTTDTSSAGLRAHRLKGLLDAFGQGESAYVGKKFSTMFKEYTFALITLNTAMLWAAADLNDGFKVGSSFGSESAGVCTTLYAHTCAEMPHKLFPSKFVVRQSTIAWDLAKRIPIFWENYVFICEVVDFGHNLPKQLVWLNWLGSCISSVLASCCLPDYLLLH